MSYELDLSGCWAKLDRATRYIDALTAEIDGQGYVQAESAGVERAHLIPIRQQLNAKHSEITFRIERLMQIGEDWPLIVGDAAHNLRCALDHLAWQLALRYFNGVPPTTAKIIRDIQFPVVLKKNDWPGDRRRQYMTPEDARQVEKFQPFTHPPSTPNAGHWLEGLAGFDGLDNIDKHRTLHLAYVAAHQLKATGPLPEDFTDCAPVIDADGNMPVTMGLPRKAPHVGDIVLRLPVVVNGPNPHVNFEPRLTAFIAVQESWDVIYTLTAFAFSVRNVIAAFEPKTQPRARG